MPAAVERIVVQATPQEKKAIAAKAKKLGLTISELMRRGASEYEGIEQNEELAALADAAKAAAERMMARIDRTWEFVQAGQKRMAAMEAAANRRRRKAAK